MSVIDIEYGPQSVRDQSGAKLTFKNVSFTIPNAAKKSCISKQPETAGKRILNSLSGSAYPGEALCIMGSSGSGKSTLLNAISDRIQAKSLQK